MIGILKKASRWVGDKAKEGARWIGDKANKVVKSVSEGARKVVKTITNSESYPGEKHMPLMVKDGIMKLANFVGPGTKIFKRLREGSKPLNETDKTAMAHDIRYTLARSKADGRDADKKFVNKLNEVVRNGKDFKINADTARKIIASKMAAEDLGFLNPEKFYDTNGKLSKADEKLLRTKLASLERQGY